MAAWYGGVYFDAATEARIAPGTVFILVHQQKIDASAQSGVNRTGFKGLGRLGTRANFRQRWLLGGWFGLLGRVAGICLPCYGNRQNQKQAYDNGRSHDSPPLPLRFSDFFSSPPSLSRV